MKRKPPTTPSNGDRPTCYGCFRPQTHCVCKLVTPFSAHCNILVLQHPNERKKYYSTVKILAAAVKNIRLMRGIEFNPADLAQAVEGQTTYLLYPGPTALDCESVNLNLGSTVIAIDGTWSEAGKILNRNPMLKLLPRISFSTPLRSNYHIRKQPKEHCLSTLESVGYLLKLNSAQPSSSVDSQIYDRLFDAFNQVVGRQLSYFPRMQATASAQVHLT